MAQDASDPARTVANGTATEWAKQEDAKAGCFGVFGRRQTIADSEHDTYQMTGHAADSSATAGPNPTDMERKKKWRSCL